MNILLIGSGGREHALAYALVKSPHTEKLYALPGNGGINQIAQAIDIADDDYDAITTFCQDNAIGLVVIGPEAPLVNGLVDHLESYNINVFGPSAAASKLEGSKAFSKEVCLAANVPTAAYREFDNAHDAHDYIDSLTTPIVVKADGLAAGKGVIIAESHNDAKQAVSEMFDGKFGDAGKRLIIEEFLQGEEASFFALCDGQHALAIGSAQDHKRVGEGDTGPNTGGMGTYSPAPVMEGLETTIMQKIVNPILKEMAARGTPYKGVLFVGLMINETGPHVIEFNVRFGDPETQVLMPLLKSDLVELFQACSDGTLADKSVELSTQAAVCVVMAANGYPDSYKKGSIIKNLDQAGNIENVIIFHAGTKADNGVITANGGRVLGVTALGQDVLEAKTKAYQAVALIEWDGGFCRDDIAWRAIERLNLAS